MTDISSAPTRPRGPYRKTAATRVSILEAALEVFSESGYHSGSLRDVARRAGISNSGLLHHFPDKIALLDAMLDYRDEIDVDTMRQHSSDGRSALMALIRLAEANASKPEIVRLYAILSTEATATDHPGHAHFVARYARAREFVREAFVSLEDAGYLSPGVSAESAAIATLAMMDGLQIQWLLTPAEINMRDELAVYLSMITTLDFVADIQRPS